MSDFKKIQMWNKRYHIRTEEIYISQHMLNIWSTNALGINLANVLINRVQKWKVVLYDQKL